MPNFLTQDEYTLLATRLQDALGLKGKQLMSIEVTLSFGPDQIITTTVNYVEFIEGEVQEEITKVIESVCLLSEAETK